jgi:hypothetical protein
MDCLIARDTEYGHFQELRIFGYDSPDRTKGWKVRYASAWIQQLATGGGGGDSRSLVQVSLATDTLGVTEITNADTAKQAERCMGPSDNRTIAWGAMDYQNRNNTNGDFLIPTSGSGVMAELISDFDRMVTNELWISAFTISELTGSVADRTVELCWYIELEEDRISSDESLFQQIKGMGQSIGPEPVWENT